MKTKGGRGTYQGKYTVKNPDKYIGKNINNITYRSSWELKVFEMCDNHPSVKSWASEILSIKYRHPNGTTKSYVPDVLIIYQNKNGSTRKELVEIKPLCQTDPKYAKSQYDKEQVMINMAKWEAARAYCRKFNIHFRIVTELNIFRNTKHSVNKRRTRRKK